MKKIMFVVYHAPCGTIWPNEGFRTAFGMYGEDIEPEVLFIQQGVISLAKETEPSKLGLFSLKMVQKYINRYGTRVIAEKESLEKYKVGELDMDFNPEVLTRKEIRELIHQKDFVVFM